MPENKVTIGEIIERCNQAGAKMGRKNPNRHLLWLCASALNQLVQQLEDLKNKDVH